MSIDAMKQALEALWNCTAKLESQLMRNPVILPTNYKDAVAEGYTAYSKLRAAITEAERQEPEQHFRYKFLDRAALDAWIATNTHPQPAIPDGWLRAVDEAMVCSHLGVADASDSYEVAKKKLNDLICWNVQVATDPSVNGGRQLVPVEPTEEMMAAAGWHSIIIDGYKSMLAAAPKPENSHE